MMEKKKTNISVLLGAAYTSVTFLRTLSPFIDKYFTKVIIGFIVLSTLVFETTGQPVKLLIFAGSVNGLILPITLGTILIGATRKDVVGDYKHPKWLGCYIQGGKL